MAQICKHYAWIAAVAVMVFFVNLGGPRLWDRDEPRNAGCAAEMLQRNDWVVPMFNAELRTHKPVLLYWFIMSAYAVFGVGEFAARFWSALFGLGTALATYHIGRRLFSANVGLWAAVILSSCMMFPVAARAATPDSLLIFLTTLATAVYVHGAFPKRETPQGPATYFPAWPTAALMYAVLGVAMLAKGPVGLVLPMAVIGMFLLLVRLPSPDAPRPTYSQDAVLAFFQRLLRPFAPRHFLAVLWSMRPLTAVAVALAVALPWYIWVGLRTEGEWPEGFFLVHHFQRATQPMESHDGPFFYYLIAIVASFFPWSLLLAPTIEQAASRIRRRAASRPAYLFVACWAVVYIAAFSMARTKLPSYVSPSLPAFALLTACMVELWRRQRNDAHLVWFRFAFSAMATLGLVVGVGIFAASFWLLPGDGWLGIIGLIPLVGGIVAQRFLRQSERRKAIAAFAATAFAFACVLFSFTSVRVARHQHNDVLFREMYAQCSQPKMAAFGCFEPSWVFYAQRPIAFFRPEEPDEAAQFLSGGEKRFLITTDERLETLRDSLATEPTIVAAVPYFMRQEQLVIVRLEPRGS